MSEQEIYRTTFISYRKEAGISCEYDPNVDSIRYNVFIHSRFPYSEIERHSFERFEEARSYAAKLFDSKWQVLSWDFKTKRPCEEGGKECGSGDCDTCRDLAKDVANDPEAKKGCGGCGLAS